MTRDSAGETALFYAVGVLGLATNNTHRLKYIAFLLDHGADINAKDHGGISPILLAVRNDDLETAKFLLEKGAALNTALNTEVTLGESSPISIAIDHARDASFQGRRRALEMIKLLLDHGAKVAPFEIDVMSADPETADISKLLKTGKLPPMRPLVRKLPLPPYSLINSMHEVAKADLLDYAWLSNDELIFQRDTPVKGDKDAISRRFLYRHWVVHNIKTGSERDLALSPISRFARPSPDGRWIVTTVGDNGDQFEWDIDQIATRGSKSFKVPFGKLGEDQMGMGYEQSPLPWLPDNRHWIMVPGGGGETHVHARIFSRDSAADTRRVDVTIPGRNDPMVVEMPPNGLIGVTPSGTALICTGMGSGANKQITKVYAFSLAKPKAVARLYSIILPFPYNTMPVLSPKGDRLAWELQDERDPKAPLEFWTTDLTGKNWHALGTIAPGDKQEFPLNLRWLPDGKRLSVFYKRGISVFPAQ